MELKRFNSMFIVAHYRSLISNKLILSTHYHFVSDKF